MRLPGRWAQQRMRLCQQLRVLLLRRTRTMRVRKTRMRTW